MSLLILEDLKKHFGVQGVLRGASLTMIPGAKIGIVGRNGGRKSILIKRITGEKTPDWGKLTIRRSARLGTVPQHPVSQPGVSVRAYERAESMLRARSPTGAQSQPSAVGILVTGDPAR